MTGAALSTQFPARTNIVEATFRREPLFAATGCLMLAMMLPTLFAAVIDPRTLQGVNIWVKPFKFQLSLALYLFTLAWFAAWLPAGVKERRWYRVYSAAVVFAILSEVVWISGAAAVGTRSHFNETSPFLTALYPVMGVLAVILTSASLVFGILIARADHNGLSPALRLSVVSGLVITFVLTVVVAGTMGQNGGPWVDGNMPGAEALPLVGWARDGGDLRVAHFFATHAMQSIPAFGLGSVALFGGKDRRPVWVFSVAFAGFVIATLVQALMGRPFPL